MRVEFTIKKSELKTSGKIIQVFSESLKKWREEEPFKLEGDELFYCPACSYVATESRRIVERYGHPRCWACGGIKMVEFDERRFKELRQKLADETFRILPRVVEALLEVAEAHEFGDLLFVEIYDQMLCVYPGVMNAFRYDAGARRFEAYFHRYDAPRHFEALKTLIKKALELNLGVLIQINPTYMKMSLPYGLPAVRPKDSIFSGVEIRMTSEELRDYFKAVGHL